MRILYSHRTRSADGQHVHIRALTEALSARGNTLAFAAPEAAAPSAKQLDINDGPGFIRRMMPPAVYEFAEYGYSLYGYQNLAKRVRSFEPDVIYERYNLHYHAGVWARRRFGLPLLLEVNAPLAEERARHGDLTFKGFANYSERAVWRGADMVLPVTNVLADYLRDSGVREDRIEIIPNGVDPSFVKDLDPQPVRERYGLSEKLVLGFSGFVRDWHGVDRVIRFIAASGRKDLHLLLVGDGPAWENLEREARERGVMSQVTKTGVVQREDMPAFIAAMDIALQPAVTAYASPLKLFEYMGMAKPVIGPATANIMEVLTHGVDSLLFRPDDGADFNAAMEQLVGDQDLRKRLGAAARKTIIDRDYTWDGNARRVEAIAARLTEKAK